MVIDREVFWKYLKDKYQEDCPYLECEMGWSYLIDQCFEAIKDKAKCLQIKEKFGGLRFYTTNVPKKVEEILDYYQELSFTICEYCGTNKNVTSGGTWVTTLCDKCRNKT